MTRRTPKRRGRWVRQSFEAWAVPFESWPRQRGAIKCRALYSINWLNRRDLAEVGIGGTVQNAENPAEAVRVRVTITPIALPPATRRARRKAV